MARSAPGVFAETRVLCAEAWRLVRQGGARLAGLILLTQLVLLLIALPLISWVFREALRANGMVGLDLGKLSLGQGFPLTMTMIAIIVAVAFWVIALQFTALVVLLRWPGLGARQFLREIGRVARRLFRPGSIPLIGYLFVLVPLTGFGFTSVLTRGIAIPSFVSGELAKSPTSEAVFAAVLLVLAWVNIRLALTVPVFVLTSSRRPLRTSWRLTRGPRAWLPIALAITVVTLVAGALGVGLLVTAVVPTALADAALPAAAPPVAAISLGAAQVVGLLLSGFATAAVAGVLITRVRRAAQAHPDRITLLSAPLASAPRTRRGPRLAVLLTSLGLAAVLSVAGWDTLHRLAEAPTTLVLAHRGFSDGGVENTLSGLDAAATAGADLVEMDVMQTADGQFVAMHDAQLSRLAGRDVAVKDLTLAEITAISVHDRAGHEDRIPSFAEYVTHAEQIGMPLLIEIKLGGADTADHVDRLVAELESLDALDSNIYHSLDAGSVERLKTLRPDLTVGYTMAFAGGGLPDTIADFIVVEQWTASDAMQRAAWDAGLGFMVWTVNDVPGMREHLRRGTDGIITDHPDQALAARTEMQGETGVSDVLVDALARFVTVM